MRELNNKGRHEYRCLRSASTSAEALAFPFAAQAARVLYRTKGRKDEEVALLTSIPSEELDAKNWLDLKRAAWGIENGLHLRLDVSQNDDRCRIRRSKGMRVMGMFRRLSNSLFCHWRFQQRNPRYLSTTDFQAAMSEDTRIPALRLVKSKRPSFKPSS